MSKKKDGIKNRWKKKKKKQKTKPPKKLKEKKKKRNPRVRDSLLLNNTK
jgi:hypothetical protein